MKVSDCPSVAPVTCYETDLISAGAKKLKTNKLRHLYVVDKKKKLLGVFAAQDVVYTLLAAGKDYRKVTVKECMNSSIVSFTKNDFLMKAVGFMSSTNILSVPIVDNGVLVGVLSYKDAMASLLREKQQRMKQQKQRSSLRRGENQEEDRAHY